MTLTNSYSVDTFRVFKYGLTFHLIDSSLLSGDLPFHKLTTEMIDKSTLINKLILRWINKKEKKFKFDDNKNYRAAGNITHTSLGVFCSGR